MHGLERFGPDRPSPAASSKALSKFRRLRDRFLVAKTPHTITGNEKRKTPPRKRALTPTSRHCTHECHDPIDTTNPPKTVPRQRSTLRRL